MVSESETLAPPLTFVGTRGGRLMLPPWMFSFYARRNAWRIALKFCRARASFTQLLRIFILTGQVRWRNYAAMPRTTSNGFFTEIAFQQLNLLPLTKKNWEIMCDLGHSMTNDHRYLSDWPATLHLDLSKVIRGHWLWTTLYLPTVAKLVVLGFLEVLRRMCG